MIRNGVDVDKLGTMVEAVKNDPKLAALRFSVKSEWKGGLKARHQPGHYTVGLTTSKHKQSRAITSDEPLEVLGTDEGTSPAEIVLAALSSCLVVGYAANAAAMGIELSSLSLEVTGDGDLQGFMNLGQTRPGLSRISVDVKIESSASQAELQQLHDYVNAHSPIWDTLANPVKVESRLVASRAAEPS